MGTGQNKNINRSLEKKLISTLLDDFEGFQTSIEKVTEAVGEIEKELELEQEPEDISELLQSQVLLEYE